MSKTVRIASTAATALAWMVMVLDVIPVGPDPTDAMGRLALLIAGVGSLSGVFRRFMCPARDLYLAGKAAGRADALREREACVASLDERRSLRVVSKS